MRLIDKLEKASLHLLPFLSLARQENIRKGRYRIVLINNPEINPTVLDTSDRFFFHICCSANPIGDGLYYMLQNNEVTIKEFTNLYRYAIRKAKINERNTSYTKMEKDDSTKPTGRV